MRDCILALAERMEKSEPSCLVTIIGQEGSTPRGPGAQMLVGDRGRISGTVGGGSIEAHAISLARDLIRKGISCTKTFSLDNRKTDALNMACGGTSKLLFNTIQFDDPLWRETCACVLKALSANSDGILSLNECNRPFYTEGTVPISGEPSLLDASFHLRLPKKQRVVIFGGGHVAQALVPVLAGVDFAVTIYENRESFAKENLFPFADKVIFGSYSSIRESLALEPNDFIVVMTHGHIHDYEIQEQLLRNDYAYIGVMGSRRKTAAVNAKLLEAGIPETKLQHVHTPIGLRIGAVTPEEIAISIAAECIAIRAQMQENPQAGCPSTL